jgi:DUF4097 and DUF4098 domain-containing protein YvlB
MKRALTFIAATALLAPAMAGAQDHDHVLVARAVIVEKQTTADQRAQERARLAEERERQQQARARERAEQNRRQYPAEQSEKSSRTLKIGNDGELSLSNIAGDIIITRGSGGNAQVDVLKIARGRTDEDVREMLGLVRVEFTERGSRAEVRTEYERREEHGRGRNVNVTVQYTVTAPENARISAHSVSGNIRVRDIKGDLNLVSISGDVVVENGTRVMSAKSTSGNVEITNLRSEIGLEANSISGNVTIRQSTGPRMEIGTVSGNLEISDVRCGRFEGQTISGDVTFNSPLEKNGRYEVSSHSGVIRFTPSGNVGFQLDVDSFSGSIQSELELKDQRQGGSEYGTRGAGARGGRVRSLRGTYGDGSAVVDLGTFSGTVIIGKK